MNDAALCEIGETYTELDTAVLRICRHYSQKNGGGTFRLSWRVLAEILGRTEREVGDAIWTLRLGGFIKRTASDTAPGRGNEYTICDPPEPMDWHRDHPRHKEPMPGWTR